MMLALSSSGAKALWYMTRGTGLVALGLLTASVLLGVLEVKRWSSTRWPRFVTAGLHRNLSLLAVAFLGVHIATAVIDGFAPIGWLDAVVPFHSPYRPLWLGLGAVATDLLIALIVTSLLRGRIGYQAWRAIHWTAYACWPVALVHGLGTGSDTKLGWVVALYLGSLLAVAAAVWWRLAEAWRPAVPRTELTVIATVASVVVPVAIVAWLLAGPLRPGWSRRAGTPASVLAKLGATVTAGADAGSGTTGSGTAGSGAGGSGLGGPGAGATPPASTVTPGDGSAFTTAFSDTLQGSLSQSAPDSSGMETVTISGDLTGSAPGRMQIVLRGSPVGGGGISMSSGSATLGPPSAPSQYSGRVVALRGARLEISLGGPSGVSFTVSVRLQLDQSDAVSGTVTGGASERDG